MHPVYGQLALAWLEAEQLANPEAWSERPVGRDEISVAIDRVIAVVGGEVTWKDASPGDKAVWKSRVADIPQFARAWRSPTDAEEKKRREEEAKKKNEEERRRAQQEKQAKKKQSRENYSLMMKGICSKLTDRKSVV